MGGGRDRKGIRGRGGEEGRRRGVRGGVGWEGRGGGEGGGERGR